jgi:hypothetical protein
MNTATVCAILVVVIAAAVFFKKSWSKTSFVYLGILDLGKAHDIKYCVGVGTGELIFAILKNGRKWACLISSYKIDKSPQLHFPKELITALSNLDTTKIVLDDLDVAKYA